MTHVTDIDHSGAGPDIATPDADTADTPDIPAELAEVRKALAESEAALAAARESLDASERRRQVERALLEADTIDLEAAAMLTEAAVAQMETSDVASAVAELRRTRPHLFRQRSSLGGAMSPHIEAPGEIERAAEQAGAGDRRALLRYLRLRRAAG